MAKTYNTFTNVSVGSVLTASDYNDALENIGNYRVPPMVKCVISGNLSYTSDTDVAWNGTDAYDTDAMHDPASNNTRITCSTLGVYLLQFSAFINRGGTSTAVLPSIRKNGSLITRQDYFFSGSGLMYVNVLAVAQVTVNTDYFTCQIGFNGGSPYTINLDSATFFSATWLGQVS
jgi:hypothetical protein